MLYLGSCPRDEQLRLANKQQKTVCEVSPMASSSRAFTRMMAVVERWSQPIGLSGQVEFFVERLLEHKV